MSDDEKKAFVEWLKTAPPCPIDLVNLVTNYKKLEAFVFKVATLTALSHLNLTEDALKLSQEAKLLWLAQETRNE